jgi:prevent-host-death family protein
MKTVTSTEVKNTFGAVMDSALVEPILVQKSGRSSVVILSITEYERLSAMEDAYWASRALKAEADGFVPVSDVDQLIRDGQGA